MKALRQMTDAERQEYSEQFEQFLSTFTLSTDDMEGLEKALDFISAIPQANDFIRQSRRFRDFGRRLGRIDYYLNSIKQRLASYSQSTNTQRPTPVTQTAHVGRPTLEEAKQRAEAKAEQEAKVNAISPSAFKEQDVEVLQGKLHLDQLTYLFDDELKEKVAGIRTMRTAFDEARTTAKVLAESNASQEKIAEAAQKAHDLNDSIEAIYEEVDRALAEVFIRLKNDDQYIEKMEKTVKDINDLRKLVKPYYKKVTEADPAFEKSVMDKIEEESPEAVAKRREALEIKVKADAIIKYLRRTDKPNTAKRISTMEKRLKELHKLIGSEADVFEPLLEQAKAHPSPPKGRDVK